MRLKIYAKVKFGHFFVFLALSSVICCPVHLFDTSCGLKVLIKKGLIKKIFREKSGRTVVHFYFGHGSLERERIFLWKPFFTTTKTVVMSVNKKIKLKVT